MLLTFAEFLIRFGEFSAIGEDLYTMAREEAERRCDPDIFGTKLVDGVAYLTAHLLAVSPYGQQARLVSKTGETVYGTEFKRIKREVCAGYRST